MSALPAARLVFVTGKGGVGKSTAASALAVQIADSGVRTHLISTDPAHSLRDVFAGEQCSPNLEIEEFDANAYAHVWLDKARGALTQLIERGTYLDAADAASFLDLSLPGVDEVMAAFRLVELHEASAERVVVDTAPTGHTLRLLDAADVIDSWAAALEAMSAKADAVAAALVGAPLAGPTQALLRDWRARSASFRALLQDADFIVITRPDAVVASETRRLRAALEARGLRVHAVFANTGPAPDTAGFIPLLPERPTGCATLRAWRVQQGDAAASPARTAQPALARLRKGNEVVDAIRGRLRLVAGKGGVGKSTCAAALALAGAEYEQTCLISTDPAGSLDDVLGIDVSSTATPVTPKLRAWQLDADQALAQVRADYEEGVSAVFQSLGIDQTLALDRAVVERFWNLAPPGIDEIVALTELTAAAENCRAVVLDSAPTGHFLRLIGMPQIAIDWSHALLRVLLKYRIAGALEGFAEDVLGFAKRTRALQQQLTAPEESAAVLVTLDEPVVWAETERLHAELVRAKIPVATLIINRAEAGHLRRSPLLQSIPRVIRAPSLPEPPVGLDGLREFLGSWELVS